MHPVPSVYLFRSVRIKGLLSFQHGVDTSPNLPGSFVAPEKQAGLLERMPISDARCLFKLFLEALFLPADSL